MRLGGEIATEAVETLKGSSGRSRNVFSEAAHGKNEVNVSDITKVEEAAVGGAVGAAIFSFKGLEVNR